MARDAAAVIDRIYEAALVPELWPAAIDGMCGLSASVSGAIFFTSPHLGQRGVSSASVKDSFEHHISL